MKRMGALFIGAIFIGALGRAGIGMLRAVQPSLPLTSAERSSSTAAHALLHRARPVRLRVPARRIDASIESVGLTARGAMDVPADPFVVGWYEQGVLPGGQGSAVFAGHRDTAWGAPGVFWTLADVAVGDVLFVELNTGEELRYIVERTEEYPYDAAPMQDIFRTDGAAFIRLITCAGFWNDTTYDRRLVVSARPMPIAGETTILD